MLTPCPRCHRHVRDHTPCPFCAVSLQAPSGAPALALVLGGGLMLAGCGGPAAGPAEETTPVVEGQNDNTPPDAGTRGDESPDDSIRTAPAYGAAPMPPPADERPAAAYGSPPMPAPGTAPR